MSSGVRLEKKGNTNSSVRPKVDRRQSDLEGLTQSLEKKLEIGLKGVQESSDVVTTFNEWVEQHPSIAIAVAAIQALTYVVKSSEATTLMELQLEIRQAIDMLNSSDVERRSISLSAGCELFNRYVTRTSLDITDFEECKNRILERGRNFAKRSILCRTEIAKLVSRFLSHGKTVLVHGRSRVVNTSLVHVAQSGVFFNVVMTEGRDDCSGYDAARELSEFGINVTIVLDSAVGYMMDKVDLVLMGAEGVVENGGVINKIGSYQIAIVAKAMHKPVYIATESYKFTRLVHLSQRDIPDNDKPEFTIGPPATFDLTDESTIKIRNPKLDYTPPQYITLLFTDLGILTPSAVSDELIKLYY